MTVKTTLSFTDRHHYFLSEKVGAGIFASQFALVAAALEKMIQDEDEREVALSAFVDRNEAFARARARLASGGR